ncbi:tetratricopeptide repeat protein [Amycolatopsis sp. cmx-11-12]|uniref:tetratricopeptide repeat protein n=1 Tax=Amycolatopsis sp. cmx-11-12 TaxID=2785795 RepID=UPI0039181184
MDVLDQGGLECAPKTTLGVALPDCVSSRLEILPVRGTTRSAPGLPGDTEYVPRDLDGDLRAKISPVVGGMSGILTLISESTAGKKRSAWEAIRWVRPGEWDSWMADWRLWPSISPSDPLELLDSLGKVGPRTVIWLPRAERYFKDPGAGVGNRIAKALRELLHDVQRAPVLIIATLRTKYWRQLTVHPAEGEDAFPHVRLLFAGSGVLVPDSFSGAEVDRALSSTDPRLAEAVSRAEAGRVIQDLVDVPELQERYDTARADERAILECIVDALSAGHGTWLRRDLLESGAPLYLSHGASGGLGDRWVPDAITELTRRGNGGRSVLIERAPVSEGDSPSYRFDDYLERRQVRDIARPRLPDKRLWNVLIRYADQGSLPAMAQECERRSLLEQAARLYLRAAKEGAEEARLDLAGLLHRAGRIDEALEQYACFGADHDANITAAEMLLSAERPEEVIHRLERLVELRDKRATALTAMAYNDLGRRDDALRLYRDLAQRGDGRAAAVAADMLAVTTGVPSAVEWLMSLANHSSPEILQAAADMLTDHEEIKFALSTLHNLAVAGNHHAYLLGAEILVAHNLLEDALDWSETAVGHEVPSGLASAARINALAGFFDVALTYATTAAANGNPEAFTAVGDALAARGLIRRALECYQQAIDEGDESALATAATVAAEAGWVTEAIGFFRGAQRSQRAPQPEELAKALCRAGCYKEAFEWYIKTVEISPPDILVPLSDSLLCEGAVAHAATSYARHAKVGMGQALCWVAEGLVAAGQAEVETDTRLFERSLGSVAVRSKKFPAAVDVFTTAAAAEKYAPARMRAVEVQLHLGRHHDARRLLEKCDPADPRYATNHILALAGEGEFGEAMVELEKQLANSNTSAVASIALSLLAREEDKEQGIALLERGIGAGDMKSRVCLADHLRREVRYTDALDHYLIALVHGHTEARGSIETLFAKIKDRGGHQRLRKYGVTPDGCVSPPWWVSDLE